jgi:hypothetical protein
VLFSRNRSIQCAWSNGPRVSRFSQNTMLCRKPLVRGFIPRLTLVSDAVSSVAILRLSHTSGLSLNTRYSWWADGTSLAPLLSVLHQSVNFPLAPTVTAIPNSHSSAVTSLTLHGPARPASTIGKHFVLYLRVSYDSHCKQRLLP